MPIYQYRCTKCLLEEEVISSVSDRNRVRFHCGEIMERIWSIPQPPIMKQTGNDMALDTLNSKNSGHISQKHKELAAQGLENNKPVIGRGF